MDTFKTPDVYVREIPVFPPSVAEVETAIPVFIGYTEKARKLTENDLILKPTKIYSFKEFENYYGGPKDDPIAVTVVKSGDEITSTTVAEQTTSFLLYHSLKLFFDNRGGQCYIISVGNYQGTIGLTGDGGNALPTKFGLQDGLNAASIEDELTLIVIPEAVKLKAAEYSTLVVAELNQCELLKDRFAIFDLREGNIELDTTALKTNRAAFGTNALKYGAAYYPFIKTAYNYFVNQAETNVNVKIGNSTKDLSKFKTTDTAIYNAVKLAVKDYYIKLPSSGAVAGVYAGTDTNRGVWKAPANVSLASVVEPVVKLDNVKQDSLNVDTDGGLSINAIRYFAGKGTLVWGARTLAGNDLEWRYISVRRFFNMVEESVKKSTYWAVFENNDANTWVKVRGMIENYLTQKWREGALAGATPKEAFYVRCGLGTTMTSIDILEGRMIVEIGMAVVRPAEFIILKFMHKMQTS